MRKACTICSNLKNPSAIINYGKSIDSIEIGPWTLWENSLDATILLVGQDWGDIAGFKLQGGKESNHSETNRNITTLFKSIDFNIHNPNSGIHNNGLFFTNAVLCLKDGGAQAKVENVWFDNCGKKFLKPLIDLINPKVVISLGEEAYKAVMKTYGRPIPRYNRFSEVVDIVQGFPLNKDIGLFPVYHPSRRIINTHRNLDAQIDDWKKIKQYLEKIQDSSPLLG